MRLYQDRSDPLTADSRLALIRTKIERAKKNLLNRETDLVTFYDECRVGNEEPKAEDQFSHVLSAPDAETIRITFDALAAAGDVVNNLWGSLDHLIYQLIEAYNPDAGDAVLEMSGFPFGKNRSAYEKAKRRRQIQFIDPLAIDILDSLKPYNAGNGALAILNELNNVSKHRLILTVDKEVMCYAEWIARMGYLPWFQYKVSDPHFVGVFSSEMNQYAHLSSQISSVETNVIWGNAMLPTLKQLTNFVDAVVPLFRPFLRPHVSPNPSVID